MAQSVVCSIHFETKGVWSFEDEARKARSILI